MSGGMKELRRQAREAGLAAGALHRGEVWPKGTLVRWKGPKTKVTYQVTDIVKFGTRWLVEITPLTRGPGRSKICAAIEDLRQVSE